MRSISIFSAKLEFYQKRSLPLLIVTHMRPFWKKIEKMSKNFRNLFCNVPMEKSQLSHQMTINLMTETVLINAKNLQSRIQSWAKGCPLLGFFSKFLPNFAHLTIYRGWDLLWFTGLY